jgi:hypothetical protein
VRGPFGAAFSLARPRSRDVPSALATRGDAASGFVGVVRFFLARGNVGVAPALATRVRNMLLPARDFRHENAALRGQRVRSERECGRSIGARNKTGPSRPRRRWRAKARG